MIDIKKFNSKLQIKNILFKKKKKRELEVKEILV